MKIIIDTHVHSAASDGVWRPSKVVREAKKAGLEVIALADHDTVFGVEEALEEGKKLGVTVIPGIEIDVEYEKDGVEVPTVEVMGLNVSPANILPFTEERLNLRKERVKSFIDNFNDYVTSPYFFSKNKESKFPLRNVETFLIDDLVAWKHEQFQYECPFFSKIDFIQYLLVNFAVPCEIVEKAKANYKDCFHEFQRSYKFLLEKKLKKPSFYEAIEIIHDAGGKAVIPHPGNAKFYKNGLVKEWENPEEEWFSDSKEFTPYKFVKDLSEHGLDGIEIYYYEGNDYTHGKDQERINFYFKKLAEELNLITTFGSDCHGPKGKGPHLGKFGSEKVLNIF